MGASGLTLDVFSLTLGLRPNVRLPNVWKPNVRPIRPNVRSEPWAGVQAPELEPNVRPDWPNVRFPNIWLPNVRRLNVSPGQPNVRPVRPNVRLRTLESGEVGAQMPRKALPYRWLASVDFCQISSLLVTFGQAGE